jgi:hypothetical protein
MLLNIGGQETTNVSHNLSLGASYGFVLCILMKNVQELS